MEYRNYIDSEKLYPEYTKHIFAMTAEGLHVKADIACELAYRDKQISVLRAACQMALEALEEVIEFPVDYTGRVTVREAITKLREIFKK